MPTSPSLATLAARRTISLALMLAVTAGLLGVAASSVIAQTAPGVPGRAVPEDVSLPIDAVFRDLRAVYSKDATADKIAVTVRERDRMPQTAVLVVRQGWAMVREEAKAPADTAPAPTGEGSTAASSPAEPVERRTRAISIDAGDLRLHVLGRTLTVTLASNPTTYFTTEVEDGPITPQLTKVIGPLPLVPLILADWRDGEAFPAIVPQIDRPGTNWFKAVTRLDPPGSPIALLGSTPFGPMSMQVDGKTFRATQALVSVSPAPRSTVMELELTSREPGDPSKWAPSLDGRTRVSAISQLARRIEPPKPPTSPEGTPAESAPDARPAKPAGAPGPADAPGPAPAAPTP